MIFHICKSLLGDKMFLCFTRIHFKLNNEVKLKKYSFEYNFIWPLEVARKLLKELLGAIEIVKTLPNKCPSDNIDILFSNVTKRLITSHGNKKYYLGLNQSTVYGSYYICLI